MDIKKYLISSFFQTLNLSWYSRYSLKDTLKSTMKYRNKYIICSCVTELILLVKVYRNDKLQTSRWDISFVRLNLNILLNINTNYPISRKNYNVLNIHCDQSIEKQNYNRLLIIYLFLFRNSILMRNLVSCMQICFMIDSITTEERDAVSMISIDERFIPLS